MNKALFLDRDGVINVERGYLYRQEEFEFIDGIFEVCHSAAALGYLLLVVTNQAGIARGYYTEADFLRVTEWMIQEFRRRNITIAKVYYCPYHLDGIGMYRRDSPDRKPKPGMLLRATQEFRLDPASSVLIGDKLSDIHAAEAAGIGTRIWLRPRGDGFDALAPGCHVVEDLHGIRKQFFASPTVESRAS
ncbi:MAG: D-glycero-alpha-D-manno-heptose-1,7-bisphosphate 7-phosphatase [Bryobacteraceae bacterium]